MMKKMYLAIFLIILIVLVFAGCLSFSNELTTPETQEEATTAAVPQVTSPQIAGTAQVPVTGVNGETVTDASGEVVTTEVYVDANGNVIPGVSVPPAASVPGTDVSEAVPPSGESVPVIPAGSNGYDILRSGNYYIKGSIVEASGAKSPMELAVTPDSIYMHADMDGMNVGMLVSGKKTYMISEDNRAYAELSAAFLKMVGMDIGEMLKTEMVTMFSELPPLADADKTANETLNGHNCTVYIFSRSDGSTRVYMDGANLIRIAYFTGDSLQSSYDLDLATSAVPAEKKAPPANYSKVSIFKFMEFMPDMED